MQALLQKKFRRVKLCRMDLFDLPQVAVAKALNKPKSTVCRWFKLRRIPQHMLVEVEEKLGYRREDVRPDLPWRK